MIAVRFSRTSLIAKPDFHIHAAISTCMRRRRATHRTAPSPASTSPPAASPSNKSSGTSSRNTASNPAAPTGATSSGDTKPGSATPNAPNPGPTTHHSSRPIPPRRDLCTTPLVLDVADALTPSTGESNGVRCQSIQGDAGLSPLLGERQIPPSPAEIGEGSSGQPASGYAKVSSGSVQTRHMVDTCSETWFTHPATRWRIRMCRLRSDG